MKNILQVILVFLSYTLTSQNLTENELLISPEIFYNSSIDEKSVCHKQGYYLVDSANANSFSLLNAQYKQGITKIKLREDTSKVLAIIEVDSVLKARSEKLFYKNGNIRSDTYFSKNRIDSTKGFSKNGVLTYNYGNNGKLFFEENYRDDIDSSLLIRRRVFPIKGLPVVIYLNLRDSNNLPLHCVNSYSDEVMTKGFFNIPADSSYQIDFKYNSPVVYEVKTVLFQGETVSRVVTNSHEKDFIYSDSYRCERVLSH
ncbi:MAG: hypothetical protein ACJAZ2_001592 [Glaciecola sp.]|jgi:hypothetical protein